jgi:hypothetical protein
MKVKLMFNFVCIVFFTEFFFHIINKHEFINNPPALWSIMYFPFYLGDLFNLIFELAYINYTWGFHRDTTIMYTMFLE